MVSFFGLKFGADKRKKKALDSSPRQVLAQEWNESEEEYIGRRESYFPQLGGGNSNRPRTSQGTSGPRGAYPGESDHDFKGIRAVLLGTTAAVPAGTGPVLSPTLKTFSSDSNLKLTLRTRGMSSTSLTMPPSKLGSDRASEDSPRPGTAHSMRGGSAAAERNPSLCINLANTSTLAFGAPPPKSPLAQGSAASPTKSDAESLLEESERDAAAGSRRLPPPALQINLSNMSTATFGNGPPSSPFSQYELVSPALKSDDTESLLGDDPAKIADEIAARIMREDELGRGKVAEERRRIEAELAVQRRNLEMAKRNLEAARLRLAFPSPPGSIEGEQQDTAPSMMTVERTLSQRSLPAAPPPHQDEDLTSRSRNATPTPSTPSSATSFWTRCTESTPSSSRQGSVPTIEAPPPSQKALPSLPTAEPAHPPPERRNTEGSLAPSPQMLQPTAGAQDHQRGATVPGANPPRSPLFQQMSPFDIHSDSDDDNDDGGEKAPAAPLDPGHRAPYGLPSPPLSHRQRPSQEHNNAEGQPVLRTVGAKRDTTTFTGAAGRRTSLGLQIEEFEKSLQQAQAMSALDGNGSREGSSISSMLSSSSFTAGQHSRGNSNASSCYSDMTESPVVMEAPLMSPNPFPLTPRPMGPRAVAPAEALRRPLEVRAESPFGSYFGLNSAAPLTSNPLPPYRVQTPENNRPASPASHPRPRLGAVNPQHTRPSLGEYGNVKLNKVAALASAGRIRRPSPDEYGIRIKQRTASPRPDSSRAAAPHSPARTDSPILNDAAAAHQYRLPFSSPGLLDDLTDSFTSSADTSRTSSPTGAVASYSVFSPPALKRTGATPRSVKPEWFGPAPTAPPSSPLPIPEKGTARGHARRKDTFDITGRVPPALARTTPTTPIPESPKTLQTSPSIVPAAAVKQTTNWPLPGPSAAKFAARTSPGGDGFGAARKSLRRARGPPAPINIVATKYADEIGDAGGPWTPDAVTVMSSREELEERPKTAGAYGEHFEIRSDFSGWREEPAPYQLGEEGDDKSGAIGMARGLSIKFDKVKESRERRARGHERMKRVGIVKVDEEEVPTVANGASVSLSLGPVILELPRRPNFGLRSPTGIADEQGVRFI